MFIKVNNETIEKYPYSIGELRKENPNTSFPKNPSTALLAEFGVFPVTATQQPSVDHTKNVIQKDPVKTNGQWTQVWDVVDASSDEIKKRTDDKAIAVRSERDEKLAETDWMVIKNLELNQNVPGIWEVYRQNLRDVPAQAGFPHNVTWPVKPS